MSLLFSAAEANSTSAASWVGSSERNFSYEGVGRVLRQIAEFLRIRTVIIQFFRAIAVAGIAIAFVVQGGRAETAATLKLVITLNNTVG